jgi:hypothetical protein
LAGGINQYGYAGGDPVNYSDPFGLWRTKVHNAIISKALKGIAGKNDIADVQKRSAEADSPRNQLNDKSHIHGMRSPGQTSVESADAQATYVSERLGAARNLLAEGDRSGAMQRLERPCTR